MPMLKLDKDDPQKELEFDVKCSLKYSIPTRIHRMLELSQALLKLAKKYENSETTQVIKRKAS